MPKYNLAVREFAMSLLKKHGMVSTANRLGIHRTTLWRWKKHGVIAKQRMFKTKHTDKAGATIATMLKANPRLTIAKLRNALTEELGITLHKRTISKYLRIMRFSRKRVRSRGVSKRQDPTICADFRKRYIDAQTSGKILVSVDECGFSDRAHSLYGYSPVGTPCIVQNNGSWKNHSLLAAVFSTGEVHFFIFDGSVVKSAFQEFLKRLNLDERHVVIADNASIHTKLSLPDKRFDILYTPPYTPEANAIELCFAQAKRHFRDNNVPGPDQNATAVIAHSVDTTMTPELIKNCFRHVLQSFVMSPDVP